MTSPVPGNTSQTARLMVRAPGFAVGWQERLVLPAPAAGQQWSHTVDGRYYERLLAAVFTFTASAVVASRSPHVLLTDADGVVLTAVSAGAGVVAGGAVIVSLAVGTPVTASAAAGHTYGFLPDLLIPPGWTWQSQVDNVDAGDQFSGIALLVHRFPNDAAVVTAAG